jgi:hypothetical protein
MKHDPMKKQQKEPISGKVLVTMHITNGIDEYQKRDPGYKICHKYGQRDQLKLQPVNLQ